MTYNRWCEYDTLAKGKDLQQHNRTAISEFPQKVRDFFAEVVISLVVSENTCEHRYI